MRYTAKSLIEDLRSFNKNTAAGLGTVYVLYGGRNGYTATDEYRVDNVGCLVCHGALEAGTPKEAHIGLYKVHQPKVYKFTRQQAKAIAVIYGIDFTKDFYQISSSQVGLLVDLAKKSKYRKPKTANGSTGRYFFDHLKNKVKISDLAGHFACVGLTD